jgi:predicted NAD-dependent protein-ADP-ribosyltransferase YbiA (DUF1768 family)
MVTIQFYDIKDKYGAFSNFYPSTIIIEGETWFTSEAYYQAQKWKANEFYYNLIKTAGTPNKAFLLGNATFLHGHKNKWTICDGLNSIVDPYQLMTINEAIAIFTNTSIDDTWKNADMLESFREDGRTIAQNIPTSIAEDWDKNKVDVMNYIVYQKFQDPLLKELLLETGDNIIEEHSNDVFWANANGKGFNMLGKVLMHVRHLLRNTLPFTTTFGSYVKLSDTLYYGIHPSRVEPNIKIDHFVSLVQDHEFKDFDTLIPTYKFPIKDRRAPTLEYLTVIVNFILTLKGVVYIYCLGGHGRSGTIAAAIWGKVQTMTGDESHNHNDTQWQAQSKLAA